MHMTRAHLLIGALVAVLVGLACNGPSSRNDDRSPTPASTSEPTREVGATATPSPEGAGAEADDLPYGRIIDLSIADIEAFWRETLPRVYGIAYTEVAAVEPYHPSRGEVPSCGQEQSDPELWKGNAFYCTLDDYIAWDDDGLFPQIYDDYGDFAISLTLAHEWGHAIQARAGVQGAKIMRELQADCFAGAWTQSVAAGMSGNIELSSGDLDEALGGYLQFSDAPGTDISDPDAHGSAFDRVSAFADGFDRGAETCRLFEEGEFTVIPLPLTVEDIETGGDLPLEEIVPLVMDDLDAHWATVFEALGLAWAPLDGELFSGEGEAPACASGRIDAPPGLAFYCAGGDFAAWDLDALIIPLYDLTGDFGAAIAVAHTYSEAALSRAGRSISFDRTPHDADCLVGVWIASILNNDRGNLRLSPGDLDEAIAAILLIEGDTGTHDPSSLGTAFERVDAIKTGINGGVTAC